jgi:hypothetical protein
VESAVSLGFNNVIDAFHVVNGAAIPLNQFAQKIFANTLLGMASSLKGVKKVRRLVVSVRKR